MTSDVRPPSPVQSEVKRSFWYRIAWFIVLWLVGVGVVGLVAYFLRLWIVPAP